MPSLERAYIEAQELAIAASRAIRVEQRGVCAPVSRVAAVIAAADGEVGAVVTRRPIASRYQLAQDELELYFAAADGMWGRRGAQPEPGGGAVQVWDEGRENLEHARRLAEVGRVYDAKAHQWEGIPSRHDELRTVTRTCDLFREAHRPWWVVAGVVLTPRRWPMMLAAEMVRGPRAGNLTGLLLSSEKLEEAWQKNRPDAQREPTSLELLDYAAQRASQSNVDQESKRRFFDALRAECEKRFTASLAAYDVLRRERVRWERDVTEFRRAMG